MKLTENNINQSKTACAKKVICRVYLFSLFLFGVWRAEQSRSEQKHTVGYGLIFAIREV
ncbi:hypothetical protein Hanom_Chr15g01390611 [Helianthus anomalus]